MPEEVRGLSVSAFASIRPLGLWLDAGLEIRVEGPDGVRDIVVDKPYARVGTHPAAEIRLRGGDVAVRDVYLHATDAGLYCCPITSINHSPAPPHGWLSPSETFSLGPYTLTIRVRDRDGILAPPAVRLDEKDPSLRLRPVVAILYDGRRLTRRALRRRLTIVGRRWPSELRIGVAALSTCHVALYWDGADLWAVDMLSRVGTWIEGDVIDAAKLTPGTHLRIGEIEIVYLGASRADSSPRAHEEPDPLQPVELIWPWTEGDLAADRASAGAATDAETPPPLRQSQSTAFRDQALQELADQRADIEAKWAELEDDRAALESQRVQWIARCAQEEQRLADRFAAVEADRAALEAARAEFDVDHQALEAQQAQWAAHREQVERQWAEQRDQLEAQRSAWEAARASIEADRAALEARLAQWEMERRQLEQQWADQQVQLEAECTAVQRDRAVAAHERAMNEADRSALEADRADLAARQADLESASASLASRHAALESFAELRAQWDTERRQCEATTRRRQEELEAEAARAARQGQELEAVQQALSQRERELAEGISELQRQRAAWQSQCERQPQRRHHREQQVDRYEQELQRPSEAIVAASEAADLDCDAPPRSATSAPIEAEAVATAATEPIDPSPDARPESTMTAYETLAVRAAEPASSTDDSAKSFDELSRRLLVVTQARSGWRARLRGLFGGRTGRDGKDMDS